MAIIGNINPTFSDKPIGFPGFPVTLTSDVPHRRCPNRIVARHDAGNALCVLQLFRLPWHRGEARAQFWPGQPRCRDRGVDTAGELGLLGDDI